ncbi:MAG: hypothetical protein QOJ50_2640, partial [Cryptosporangiaceae bacterium]|nr:hypothetical protein [Cryptosporangiaceae bacterium]
MTGTAGELYRTILRDVVGPALRRQGFRGSVATFRLRTPAGDLGELHFARRTRGNTPEHTSFSVSARFRSRYRVARLRLAGMPVRIPRDLLEWDLERAIRDLGSETLSGAGLYPLHASVTEDPTTTAAAVLTSVERYAVPFVTECLTAEGFVRQVDRYPSGLVAADWSAIMAELELGRVDAALTRIVAIQKWRPDADHVWDTTVTEPFVALTGFRPEEHPDFPAPACVPPTELSGGDPLPDSARRVFLAAPIVHEGWRWQEFVARYSLEKWGEPACMVADSGSAVPRDHLTRWQPWTFHLAADPPLCLVTSHSLLHEPQALLPELGPWTMVPAQDEAGAIAWARDNVGQPGRRAAAGAGQHRRSNPSEFRVVLATPDDLLGRGPEVADWVSHVRQLVLGPVAALFGDGLTVRASGNAGPPNG